MSLEGSVIQVSLHPGQLPSKCIASFAVGSPVLVHFASNTVKPLPALVMGKSDYCMTSYCSLGLHSKLLLHSDGRTLLLLRHKKIEV